MSVWVDIKSGSPISFTSLDTGYDAILNENISGSYNGRRAVSETDNEGPTPSPEADLNEAGYSTGKWSDDDDFGITPFLGPNR